MLKRYTKRFVWSTVILCLVPLTILHSQDEAKTDKKPELIVMQVKVTDKKTGSAIDNADVQVKYEGQEVGRETTNSKGIARLEDIPRGMVVVRVIAKGYKVPVPPKVNLKNEAQPVRIELDKLTLSEKENENG
jgi:hypothetical protein